MNSMLLKVLDYEKMALQLKDEEMATAHKMRIASLEQTLHNSQDEHLKRVHEELDNNIEIQIQLIEMRRWSSANSCRTHHPLSQPRSTPALKLLWLLHLASVCFV